MESSIEKFSQLTNGQNCLDIEADNECNHRLDVKAKYIKIISDLENMSNKQKELFEFVMGEKDLTNGISYGYQSNDEIYSIDHFLNKTEENPELFSDVLTIDLNGLKISVGLLEQIITYCPLIQCLYMNITEYSEHSWSLFQTELAFKLKHISIDNSLKIVSLNNNSKIYPNFEKLLENMINLEELKVIIFPNESKFNYQCLENVSKNFVYFYLNVKKNIDRCSDIVEDSEDFNISGEHPLDKILYYLSKGNGNKLEFLRSNNSTTNDISSVIATNHLSNFKRLRVLNLSFPNSEGEVDYFYEPLKQSENLESLTINSYDDFKEWVSFLSNSKFKKNLNRLRLIDTVLELKPFREMSKSLHNLKSLQLIDCIFSEDSNIKTKTSITKLIVKLDLHELIVENSELFALKHFNYFDFNFLKTIIKCSPNLKRVGLVKLALISEKQLESIQKICLNREPIIELTQEFNRINQISFEYSFLRNAFPNA